MGGSVSLVGRRGIATIIQYAGGDGDAEAVTAGRTDQVVDDSSLQSGAVVDGLLEGADACERGVSRLPLCDII
jgi:hypothetical protein